MNILKLFVNNASLFRSECFFCAAAASVSFINYDLLYDYDDVYDEQRDGNDKKNEEYPVIFDTSYQSEKTIPLLVVAVRHQKLRRNKQNV